MILETEKFQDIVKFRSKTTEIVIYKRLLCTKHGLQTGSTQTGCGVRFGYIVLKQRMQ